MERRVSVRSAHDSQVPMPDPLARPRVLLITRNLPPLVGGMERLNWHMAEELAKVADVHVVGPGGSAAVAPAGVRVAEAPLRPLWKFLLRARALARREALAWKPDIVLAGSGLTAPIALSAAGTCGARVAAYVHGLDIATKHPVYRAGWLPALRRLDTVIANSHATAALCREIGIEPARVGIVHPGVELPADAGGPEGPTNAAPEAPASAGADSRDATRDTFRQRHDLGNRPLLLSVGRLTARKGLREFVSQALPRIASAHPNVMLLVVGDAPKDALHAQAQTPASIQAAAERGGVAENLRFLGKVSDDELEEIYRAADVHVFPVREIPGDPEGFGMVAIEAAARGLPTVAFANGGVVDAVAEGESGRLIEPGNHLAFANAVARTLAEREALRSPCVAFARGFAWPTFGAQLVAQLSIKYG